MADAMDDLRNRFRKAFKYQDSNKEESEEERRKREEEERQKRYEEIRRKARASVLGRFSGNE